MFKINTINMTSTTSNTSNIDINTIRPNHSLCSCLAPLNRVIVVHFIHSLPHELGDSTASVQDLVREPNRGCLIFFFEGK